MSVPLFEIRFNVEDSVMIIHEINVFECDVFIPFHVVYVFSFVQYLSFVGCSFDVIAFIDVQVTIKYVADNNEIDGSVAVFIFHFV